MTPEEREAYEAWSRRCGFPETRPHRMHHNTEHIAELLAVLPFLALLGGIIAIIVSIG